MTTWVWAKVTQTSPLLVQLDGDTAPLIGTPDTLLNVGWLTVGARVRCELTDHRLIVHGVAGGVPPAPVLPAMMTATRSADTNNITATAVWGQTVPFTGNTLVVPAGLSLLALVTSGAWLVATAGETRAGVQVSGATTIAAAVDQNGQSAWGQTLYVSNADIGAGTAQATLQRTVVLAAGTNTFTLVAYQSSGGTHQVNYPTLEVTPLRYV